MTWMGVYATSKSARPKIEVVMDMHTFAAPDRPNMNMPVATPQTIAFVPPRKHSSPPKPKIQITVSVVFFVPIFWSRTPIR